MTHIESIEKGIDDKLPLNVIIRKVYLSYPTNALIGEEERQFLIFNEISEYFKIPIVNVQVVGSAKTGHSFHKNTPFTAKTSDLDIAIIDTNLFLLYTEWVFKTTKGFTDRSGFPIIDGVSTYNQYIQYVAKGIFRPDLMPSGNKRINWLKFFGNLSSQHKDLFKSINGGIYMSQLYFEYKQTSIINNHLSNKAI